MAEFARNETEQLSQRVKSGLAEARRKGKFLGRPKGWRQSEQVFLKRHEDIVRHLGKGLSSRTIRKVIGRSPTTVQKVKGLAASHV